MKRLHIHLKTNDLEESIIATPAIVGTTVYIRTEKNLFAVETLKP